MTCDAILCGYMLVLCESYPMKLVIINSSSVINYFKLLLLLNREMLTSCDVKYSKLFYCCNNFLILLICQINKWTVPGPSTASQVRSLRKVNNDQFAVAIDMDPGGTSRLEDEDDEKGRLRISPHLVLFFSTKFACID